ncbi:MAG: carboxypeptidase-like regulatory domain-containing protein, partial [Bacteroidota bacterium]
MCFAIPKNSWWLTTCFSLLVVVLHAQSTSYTLRGTIRDADGERLAGASVYVLPSLTGATTDGRGNYALSLQEGTYSLVVSFIGYRNDTTQLTMDRDQQHDVVLES